MDRHRTDAIVLGTAQDGGIPQIGCMCPNCQSARIDDSKRRLTVSLGIVNHGDKAYWLVDASPNIGEQLHQLGSRYPAYRLAGILLTHAHMGHYLGLAFLGREALNTQCLPVLCTKQLANLLQTNQPWRQLVDLGNIEMTMIAPDQPIHLGSSITTTAVPVPHRGELSDTMAFCVAGASRSLVYCPNIDCWGGRILDAVKDADVALLDGTFYSADELPGRRIADIPHPCINESMATFSGYETEIQFIHLNHSNPLLGDEELVARLEARGFAIGKRGDVWKL